ncbi:Rne/Rng family ribonuclease [Sinorhizobium medicae]|uniref:Ribonuclease E n=3 Tax=Sinorhizobium medicae TaxID=110321 RepID=A0A6G1WD25_9HYPH|nr:ribonuclease E/G [Sinorhizobium medicae]ABR59810.1 ribonuclease, Rne/Rng family [Sinorhizobium medicae WSM419]MBO1962834.1 ribonuclease E/G [Sinorhizobium medicae]MDX0407308.1 Rne/Rng family ribonuclease [Sinorhizobium medicae]MDX0413640.1 Rne/Rng family ribonuclease [Sinorhizobium medicae]MDX0419238.1 Rne/Rng family ribonuclease [Sinorhizobium medicae]
MAEKMLIDASHSEETRVVVVRGNRIEEFDFESEHKKQIRGNIYLAKVTRVEPSLQAAFVDYGGNRHGFLAFAEIHPDYYQIPLADRQALLKAEAEEARREDDIEPMETSAERKSASSTDSVAEVVAQAEAAEAAGEAAEAQAAAEKPKAKAKPKRTRRAKPKASEETAASQESEAPEGGPSEDGESDKSEMAAIVETDSISEDVDARRQRDDDDDDDNHDGEKEIIESVGAEDAMEEVAERQFRKPRKQYRIQEVIKRRQILLVQVAKEERGNKGAALTTYLSLAGRYSVLMPNTARGGGISRKITNLQDRKRLKEIARGLDVPQGMGVILRTAGANRTKVEIKRDFEYLMRLWENVRTLTLNSTAPCLVYEEGSLIKRSIRDLYNKDISEIVVSGEEGYKEAKGFMKMLMPSHAKVVQPYRDVHPIFSRSGIEAQLDRMLQPQVTLKSGGYIIINQTEALVSIDVNSGRSTREHSIEDTALQTNLEAAEEVARQLRLRDLAGLIVIDFIDMEEKRNNRSVEKKLKDCLKNDRARIQVGRISHFGLLEMSRQRIRASVLESTMQTCPHCNGTGHIRSQSSVALHVLRGIEEHLLKNTTHDISVRTTPDIALYLLNQKRSSITDYEQRFGVSIFIEADAHVGAQHFAIDRGEPVENPVRIDQILQFEPEPEEEEEEEEVLIEEELDDEEAEETAAEHQDQQKGQPDDQGGRKRKRRRRRRGKGAGQGADAVSAESADAAEDEAGDEAAADDAEDELDAADSLNGDSEQKRKRRRRGKRGGRRNRQEELAGSEGETGATAETVEEPGEESVDSTAAEIPAVSAAEEAPADVAAAAAVEGVAEEPKPAKPRRSRKKTTKTEEPAVNADEVAEKVVEAQPEPAEPAPQIVEEAVEEAVEDLEGAKPARSNRDLSAIASKPVVTSSKGESEEEPTKPKKGGWWQRRGFF